MSKAATLTISYGADSINLQLDESASGTPCPKFCKLNPNKLCCGGCAGCHCMHENQSQKGDKNETDH